MEPQAVHPELKFKRAIEILVDSAERVTPTNLQIEIFIPPTQFSVAKNWVDGLYYSAPTNKSVPHTHANNSMTLMFAGHTVIIYRTEGEVNNFSIVKTAGAFSLTRKFNFENDEAEG